MPPTLFQDWVTLKGQGGGTPVIFRPHRDNWLWTGDADGAVLQVEIAELTGATTPPTLVIETAASEDGDETATDPAWTAVGSYTAPGSATIYLRRDPAGTSAQHLAGIIRWKITEGTGAWTVTFRVTVLLEN